MFLSFRSFCFLWLTLGITGLRHMGITAHVLILTRDAVRDPQDDVRSAERCIQRRRSRRGNGPLSGAPRAKGSSHSLAPTQAAGERDRDSRRPAPRLGGRNSVVWLSWSSVLQTARSTKPPNGPALSWPAARECTKSQPADAPRAHPGPGRPAGWEARQVERRRPVSCSALLGGQPTTASGGPKLCTARTPRETALPGSVLLSG